jgi:hypothetical protein
MFYPTPPHPKYLSEPLSGGSSAFIIIGERQGMQQYEQVITAFTLNYSGILDSPYEFYSNEF